MTTLLFAAMIAVAAAAKPASSQKDFDLQEGSTQWTFDYRWRDAAEGIRELSFVLPAAAMDADRDEVTFLKRRELNESAAAAVRAWGKTVPGVKIKAVVDNGGVLINASGPRGETRAALGDAADVRDAAVDAWLVAHDFTRMQNGDLTFDHAGLVSEYAASLAPVAAALRAGTQSDRAFVDRALSFVQSIPYEARKKKGGDPGYRRPLALLSRNRGDCDSKSVLFLAIVHAELPRVPLSVVYVPGHALTGVGLEAQPGDRSFKVDGQTFLYAEPVGPAQHPLGEPADANKKAGKKGEVHIVP